MKTVRIRRFSSVLFLFSATRRPEAPLRFPNASGQVFVHAAFAAETRTKKRHPRKTKRRHPSACGGTFYPERSRHTLPISHFSQKTSHTSGNPSQRTSTHFARRSGPSPPATGPQHVASPFGHAPFSAARMPFPPPSRHVPDRTNRSCEPLILCPRSFRHPSHKPLRSSITTVPYVRTASHRIRSPANDAP